DDCRNLIKLSGIKIIDFCEGQALITAKIIKQTKQYGLSLGDRGCIALAMFKNCPILTCDKIWQKVALNVEYIMAR
ncbi:PIN domain-containing protein, partial [Rickettsiales endosymbiont of Peranema trichophorum]|uniref:PIN domain-containing protein n=1 Tax=Rickettsiales endosymbiont of Peranema trichophorum TaxID=2486577 RepID=UPI0010235893